MNLNRFFSARSIAVYGGAWAENVIKQLQRSSYSGDLWAVHPSRKEILGVKCYASTDQLPASPDAAFIGVNRELTITVLAELNAINAGGAICFASGFRESGLTQSALGSTEVQRDDDLQAQLIEASGQMPVLGPNCYGFLNYLDNVHIWPDQHGGEQVESGVAIVAQSSNIAINMTMQKRGLSLTHMITAGNQAKVDISDIVEELLTNSNVNAIGLYLEGFGHLEKFERMALAAKRVGKPIVAIKIGKSKKAQAATLSHTASLAGSASASSAFLKRLGIVEVDSVSTFIETLKLLNGVGPLKHNNLTSVSCSGGEASLMADLGEKAGLSFEDFSQAQVNNLEEVLGDKVDIANPLDYHTYIWGNVPTMTRCFEAVVAGDANLNVFVLDIPRSDKCDTSGHECAIEAIIETKRSSGKNIAVITSMAENLEPEVTQRFVEAGVVPLHGMMNGLSAIAGSLIAGKYQQEMPHSSTVLSKQNTSYNSASATLINEYEAKQVLQKYGLRTPRSMFVENVSKLNEQDLIVGFPLALKGLGLAHKTEAGAVVLGINSYEELIASAAQMPLCPDGYMLETMVTDAVAELIVGVSFDPTGLALLTIGAGGIYTELFKDSVSLILPVRAQDIVTAVDQLKISNLLNGYRGKPAANKESLIKAIEAVAAYAQDHCESLVELDVNPLMVGEFEAIAVDALIRLLPLSR